MKEKYNKLKELNKDTLIGVLIGFEVGTNHNRMEIRDLSKAIRRRKSTTVNINNNSH